MPRFTSRALLLLLCMGVVAGALRFAGAQSSVTGAITGVVTDQSGAVIVGAKVRVVNVANNAESSTTTDGSGRFLAGLLQPSTYNVEVSASGFGTYKHAAVIVEVGRSTFLDVTLKPATAESVVTTTAEAPVVETTRSDFSTNINRETMENSPVNVRRWSTFALTTPGATPDGTFGLTSFRGISGLLNNNTVDGADNNQAFFSEEKGRSRISYSISEDSIQEFQVNTSDYSAQYGRAAGAVINAVTKSGTNSLHGTAYWYYRSSDFGATNPFSLAPMTINGVTTSVPVNPPDKRHQFGGNFGGALIKDKLFYFFSADQQLRNFPALATPSNPTAFFSQLGNTVTTCPTSGVNSAATNEVACLATYLGISQAQAQQLGNAVLSGSYPAGTLFNLAALTGTVPRTGDELVLFPKIDWNVTPKHHASFQYNRMRWSSPAGIQTAGVVFRGKESLGDDFVKADTGIARLTSTVSPTIVNEALFNYGRDFEFEFGQPSIPGEPVSQQGVSPQIGISGAAALTFGKPNFLDRPDYPDERRIEVGDTLSWSRGKHLFKFGGNVNHVDDVFNNLFQGAGQYSYSNRVLYMADYIAANTPGQGTFCGTNFAAASCYSTFNQGLGPAAFEFATWDLGFFANDDWRIAPRLTLTLGMRWEYEKMPAPQIPNPALPLTSQFPSDKGDFGPRLGFALDLGGSQHKTVLRGGYGVYFGRIINSTISNAIVNTAVISGGTTTISGGIPRITGGAPLSQISVTYTPTTAGAPHYPNVALFPSTGPTLAAINPPNVIEFAPNTRLPLVHEYDLAFEREIANNTAVSVSYLGSQGRRLPIFIDTNLAPPTSTVTYKVNGGPLNGQSFTVPLFTSRGLLNQPPTACPLSPTGQCNPNFGAITQISDIAQSMYNAVVFGFNRRMSHGLQVQASYTYAHASDQGQSSTTFTATNNLVNPYALFLEQGRSIFDIRQRVVGSAIWQPPFFHNKSALERWLLDGFSFSPVVSAASGAPYSGFVSGNAPGVPSSCIGCTGIIGAGGSARAPFVPRDTFTMPNTVEVDLRVAKKFWYKERASFELLADVFNILNRVNATAVSGALGGSGSNYTISGNTLTYVSTFGSVTNTSSTLGGPGQRQIQIGARLNW